MEKTPTLERIREARREFKLIKSLTEETHLFKRILKCNKCGQIYLYVFFETIDWERPNEPQFTTFIPVKNKKEAEELNNKTVFELNYMIPRLQHRTLHDDPGTIEWVI